MDLGLSGRACAVTGASRGIGLEISRLLAAEGAAVLLVARDPKALAEAAAICVDAAAESGREANSDAVQGSESARAAAQSRVATLCLDVTESDSGERILAGAEQNFGRLDVLVNNAGSARWARIEDLSDDEWRHQFEINVMAPMRAMKAAVPAMAERGWGRVVNVCSTSGKRPSAFTPHYSAAKAAEFSLSRWFADRYANKGVLINAVSPGPALSPMWIAPGGLAEQAVELTGASSPDEAIQTAASSRPIDRFAEPEEIAAVTVFLCSERASYVSGASWSVDGGTVPVII